MKIGLPHQLKSFWSIIGGVQLSELGKRETLCWSDLGNAVSGPMLFPTAPSTCAITTGKFVDTLLKRNKTGINSANQVSVQGTGAGAQKKETYGGGFFA